MLLSPCVLVVAAPGDLGADLVVRELESRDADVHRIDPNDLARPGVLRMSGHSDNEPLRFRIDDGHRRTLSASIVSVFWWHPEPPNEWAQGESRTVLESFLYGLDGVLWVNHPHKILAAKPGPAQLKLASSLGFRTPPALYTNDPDDAAAFAREHGGQVICKTLTGHPEQFVPARIVTAEEIEADGENVRQAVHYFQQLVDKVHDIRLTVIGERSFPCKITTSQGVDWRAVPEEELAFEPTSISLPLATKVNKLMSELGLEYAALDFSVDASGTWWFLEANPSGQFGFVQAATGMIIARSIADHLTQAAMATRVFTSDGGHRASSGPGRRRKAAGE
jgi:hypothetical protein